MTTALIVDDEEDIRSCIRKYLSRKGWGVLEARTYAEAIELSDSCDVIVLDYALDGANTGEHVLKVLKERNNIVPVIVISGVMPSREAIARLYDMGVVQYLDKPVRLHVLFEMLDKAIHLVEVVDRLDEHSAKLLSFVGAAA